MFKPVDVLTDEEARLLQRLDLLEADEDAMDTRAGKILRTQNSQPILDSADRP